MLRQRYCSVETRRASALIIMLIFSNHLTSHFVSITTSQSSFDFFSFFSEKLVAGASLVLDHPYGHTDINYQYSGTAKVVSKVLLPINQLL